MNEGINSDEITQYAKLITKANNEQIGSMYDRIYHEYLKRTKR